MKEFYNLDVKYLLGLGEYGHYASGISVKWQNIFSGFEEGTEMVHPHNSVFMIIFDYGYLGLLLFILLLRKNNNQLIKLYNYDKIFSVISLNFLLYIILIGMTESIIGFYYQNFIYLIYAYFLIVFNYFLHHENKTKRINLTASNTGI
jgi:O-antigen ligase